MCKLVVHEVVYPCSNCKVVHAVAVSSCEMDRAIQRVPYSGTIHALLWQLDKFGNGNVVNFYRSKCFLCFFSSINEIGIQMCICFIAVKHSVASFPEIIVSYYKNISSQ